MSSPLTSAGDEFASINALSAFDFRKTRGKERIALLDLGVGQIKVVIGF
jgi:hypothetical protein